MEVDSENDLLSKTAAGELVESEAWPALRDEILSRLDKIARDEFPIPKLPPPLPHPRLLDTRVLSPLSSSPAERSFEDANKENESAPAGEQPPSTDETEPVAASQPPPPPPAPAPSSPQSPSRSQEQSDDVLPKQLADMVGEIKSHIGSFKSYPPHTIQRIAELILYPRAHYKALASYLHALDRVSAVTSGTNTYPLPPPIPDMSAIQLNGDEPNDPAMAVSWSNPTSVAVGSDEALGGALLTPIPWLTRGTPPPETVVEAPVSAQIHSESTETIEGPNGVGSIETVSVSINGVPSMGATRGVTQGELLRQEQRAGIVPVTQLTKSNDMMGEGEQSEASEDQPMGDDDEEAPHARGPDEIGVGDTGLQSETTSLMGEDGVEMEGIDLEAAVGRKHADDKSESSATGEEKGTTDEPAASSERAKSPSAESVSSKREAEDDLEDDVVAKKVKEDPSGDGDTQMTLSSEKEPDSAEQKDEGESKEDETKDGSTD
ncbi:hypothetical protein TGAMA5MH_02282 [Trichoderma gamsii]|uniref:Protein phosphatase 4 core regulatory subunit R2 n=1 Tax=Trichoderma gamsii TaxID=398673 RepID=A0A2K0TL43_9HYPO|nr:hypothetical protein TGAMA5MH_02282 [Trichoderma gamsii]